MEKIAIVTDSNSGITQEEAAQLGVTVVPMPFYIDNTLFFEGISLSQEQFYEKLKQDAQIHTSQPTPLKVTETWDGLLADHDAVLYIPMSSGLSTACASAQGLARNYGGRVCVVDNQRISVTQRRAVLDALLLAKRGMCAREIQRTLEEMGGDASIYITLETLQYIKKGGRITPAAATLGTILNIKPVLQIQGEKLDAFSKARGKAKARRIMLDAIRKDLETRFRDAWERGEMALDAAYGGNKEEAEDWLAEIKAHFPDMDCQLFPLSLSVACHIGYGPLAIACARCVR